MPLPAERQARLDEPDFWRAYFFDGGAEGRDGTPSAAAEFAVGGGFGAPDVGGRS